MASFTAGTSFTDGVANDVTAAKLGALVTNATPTSGFIQDRTAETVTATNDTLLIGDASDSNNLKRITVANFAQTLPTVKVTTGTIETGTFGTTTATVGSITTGTIATGTFGTTTSTAATITTGTIPTLAATTKITTGSGSAADPFISPTGDTDTGLLAPAANTVAISTFGTERARVNSSGQLLVGTTSAGGFDIARFSNTNATANDVSIIGANTSQVRLFFGDTDSNQIGEVGYNHSINAMRFVANGTVALTINSGGDVTLTANKSLISRGGGGITSNCSIGEDALGANTTGIYNTAAGQAALSLNTTGSNNTAVGSLTLGSNTTGLYNVAVGGAALKVNTSGDNNTAIGYGSLIANTTGSDNTGLGSGSLFANTTGSRNVAIGRTSLFSNTTGWANVAVGYQSLYANTSGLGNISVGYGTLLANTTGSRNVAVGNGALDSNTTAGSNVAIGAGSLNGNTTGSRNTGIGTECLYANLTGNDNVAVGQWSMYNNTGSNNIGIGFQALNDNGAGANNTAVGYQALTNSTAASNNTGIGYLSLGANTTGSRNTSVGASSLGSNTTGNLNTAIGFNAGASGANANTTGTNNTFIGNGAVGTAVTSSNTITLGDSAITTLRCAQTSITAISDERDKTDIEPIQDGLALVEKLNPVKFKWNMRDGGKVGQNEIGFIAQHLVSAQSDSGVYVPNLVNQENPDRLEAAQGTLIPILVKAIQQLSQRVKDLESK